MGLIGVLLSQQGAAVFFAVDFNDAAVRLVRENQLTDTGQDAGIDEAGKDGENHKYDGCPRQDLFQCFHIKTIP